MTKFECHFAYPKTTEQEINLQDAHTRLLCWHKQTDTPSEDMNAEAKLMKPPTEMQFFDLSLEDEYVCKLLEWKSIEAKIEKEDVRFKYESFMLYFETIPESVDLFEIQLDFMFPKPSMLYHRNENGVYFLSRKFLKMIF